MPCTRCTVYGHATLNAARNNFCTRNPLSAHRIFVLEWSELSLHVTALQAQTETSTALRMFAVHLTELRVCGLWLHIIAATLRSRRRRLYSTGCRDSVQAFDGEVKHVSEVIPTACFKATPANAQSLLRIMISTLPDPPWQKYTPKSECRS